MAARIIERGEADGTDAAEPSDAAAVQGLAGDLAIADTTLTIPHPYEGRVAAPPTRTGSRPANRAFSRAQRPPVLASRRRLV